MKTMFRESVMGHSRGGDTITITVYSGDMEEESSAVRRSLGDCSGWTTDIMDRKGEWIYVKAPRMTSVGYNVL